MFCGTRDSRVAFYWIDTLVLKIEGNTYATLLHHPLLFGEIQRSAQEVARRISGAVAGEVRASQDLAPDNEPFLAPLPGSLCKSQHTKYPSQSLSPALHYLPFATRFPLPQFTLAVLFALSLYPSSLCVENFEAMLVLPSYAN